MKSIPVARSRETVTEGEPRAGRKYPVIENPPRPIGSAFAETTPTARSSPATIPVNLRNLFIAAPEEEPLNPKTATVSFRTLHSQTARRLPSVQVLRSAAVSNYAEKHLVVSDAVW